MQTELAPSQCLPLLLNPLLKVSLQLAEAFWPRRPRLLATGWNCKKGLQVIAAETAAGAAGFLLHTCGGLCYCLPQNRVSGVTISWWCNPPAAFVSEPACSDGCSGHSKSGLHSIVDAFKIYSALIKTPIYSFIQPSGFLKRFLQL